jgi:hypothetical protein
MVQRLNQFYTKKVFLLSKAVDMDIYFAGQLGDLGKSLYEQSIKEAAFILRLQLQTKI